MCIRDRDLVELVVRVESKLDIEVSDEVAEEADTALTWAKAVSYTHLRAHETVLDLVCRLLLEKKKHLRP